jgi:hypothetical protein
MSDTLPSSETNETLSDDERQLAIDAVLEAMRTAEQGIPARFVKSRALTIIVALWRIGWRPTVRRSRSQ